VGIPSMLGLKLTLTTLGISRVFKLTLRVPPTGQLTSLRPQTKKEEKSKKGCLSQVTVSSRDILGSPGRVKKSVSFKKDPKYYDPSTKMLRFIIGGNPKSNKACPKEAAGKKCAGPCAFRH